MSRPLPLNDDSIFFEEVKVIARKASVDIKAAEHERSKRRAAEAKTKRLEAKTKRLELKQKPNVEKPIGAGAGPKQILKKPGSWEACPIVKKTA